MNRVIITAAGEGSRWGDYLGVPKHLLPAPDTNETLLRRTVRLCRIVESDPRKLDIVVSGPDDPRYRFDDLRSRLFVPTDRPDDYECSMYTWTHSLWNETGKTVYLYGDTFYTLGAINTILDFEPREWHLFARFKHSTITGKPWPEVWAHSFWPEHRVEEAVMIQSVVEARRQRRIPRASIYEMYKERHGKLVGKFSYDQHDYGELTQIDDWTEDFDYPKDYEAFVRRYRERA